MSSFHLFNILTEEECQQNLSLLDQLSDRWISRLPGIPFYTLGTPLYMDKEESEDFYKERVLEMNELLSQHFGSLLTKVRHCLESYLNSKVLDFPGVSLPGFHIFGSNRLFTQPIAKVHFDLQYEKISWPEPPSLDSVVSFTLPIVLPQYGGGLNWWDIEFDADQAFNKEEQEGLHYTKVKNYLPYEAGKIVMHSGHLLHQIAPATQISPSDRRVTLQGHAIRVGGTYYWYW